MLKLSKEKLLEIEKQLGFDKLKDFDIKSKGSYKLNNDYTLIIEDKNCSYNSWLAGTTWTLEKKAEKTDIYHFNSSIFKFFITGWPSGCGAGFIHNLRMERIDEELSSSLLQYVLNKGYLHEWGAIMTTYGETYRKGALYKMLLSIGFTELSKYRNTLHGPDYYQYLLQLILKP